MEGRLSIQSEVNVGTTVMVSFQQRNNFKKYFYDIK